MSSLVLFDKLLALTDPSKNPHDNEARNAAMQVCRMIREGKVRVVEVVAASAPPPPAPVPKPAPPSQRRPPYMRVEDLRDIFGADFFSRAPGPHGEPQPKPAQAHTAPLCEHCGRRIEAADLFVYNQRRGTYRHISCALGNGPPVSTAFACWMCHASILSDEAYRETQLGTQEGSATPHAFRDVLLGIARQVAQ